MVKLKYSHAPLGFGGQKRFFLQEFCEVINNNIPNNGGGYTFLDAFGGSGLLSRTLKDIKPEARVIYNDFSNYSERLRHVDETNELRRLLRAYLDQRYKKHDRVSDEDREAVIKIIDDFSGYKDIKMLSSCLLFSGKTATDINDLKTRTFYSNAPLNKYRQCDDYLEGLEITHQSFKELLPQFYDDKKCVFILDPPYLMTDCSYYKDAEQYNLISFLTLSLLLRPPFVFFSSSKTEFYDYMQFAIEHDFPNADAFKNVKNVRRTTHIGAGNRYEDAMFFDFG